MKNFDDGDSLCVVQFAKVPKPGHVKTRTTPGLTQAQALQLHKCLMKFTHRQVSSGDWDYCLYLSESGYDQQVLETLGVGSTDIDYQSQGDLGQRMHQCFASLLQRYKRVILVGSDCPYIDSAHIAAAAKVLRSQSCVVTPAEDGGYVLIGLNRVSDSLFQNIPWGGDRVLECTEQQLKALGWDYCLLAPMLDIDTIEDLTHLMQDPLGASVLGDHYREFVSRLSAASLDPVLSAGAPGVVETAYSDPAASD